MTGIIGTSAGFLARISSLEREVNFLKQKVEDDARWKYVVQQWVDANFAFDIQDEVVKSQRQSGTNKSTPSRPSPSKRKTGSHKSGLQTAAKRKTVDSLDNIYDPAYRVIKLERVNPMETHCRRRDGSPSQLFHEEGEDLEEDSLGFVNNSIDNDDEDETLDGIEETESGIEINLNPQDLIITPDNCDDEVMAIIGDDDRSDSSSDEESNRRRCNKRLQWTPIATFANIAAMKEQFNLHEWGHFTKQSTSSGCKIYYYCKDCTKKGPGRLLVRYRSEDSEVEVLRNSEHDHSKTKRVSAEMKMEVVNLYKAGMKDSTKILGALKISKPHLRPLTVKQVCNILKPHRHVERRQKSKAKKLAIREKEMQKTSKVEEANAEGAKKSKKKKQDAAGGSHSNNPIPPTSVIQTTTGGIAHQPHQPQLNSYLSPDLAREFQRSQILSSSFPTTAEQLQFFQQQHGFTPYEHQNSCTSSSSSANVSVGHY